LVLTIKFKTRTKPQNAAIGVRVGADRSAGRPVRTALPAPKRHEQFKRQFIGVIELPNGQVIGESSAKLSTAEFSEFCGQVEAFAATELGVTFTIC
jgi:hypothetical protein